MRSLGALLNVKKCTLRARMIFAVDENIPLAEAALSPWGEVRRFAGRQLTSAWLADVDALFVRSVTKVNAELLQGSAVRHVATATAGTEHVDEAWLRAAGISFASAPGSNAASVVDWVLSVLAVDGLSHPVPWPLTVGIVGAGQVGGRLGHRLAALGCRVLRVDPPLQDQGLPGPWYRMADLVDADVVSFHVPLVLGGAHPTRSMIGADWLRSLKKRPLILNACRGEVSVESDLLRALDAGWIRGFALDVFEREPDPRSEVVERALVATPHIAGYAAAAKVRGWAMVVRDFQSRMQWAGGLDFEAAIRDLGQDGMSAEVLETAASGATLHPSLAAYDVRLDSEVLKGAIAARSDLKSAFDQHRKRYPLRLEFEAFRFPVKISVAARNLALALGFQPELLRKF